MEPRQHHAKHRAEQIAANVRCRRVPIVAVDLEKFDRGGKRNRRQ